MEAHPFLPDQRTYESSGFDGGFRCLDIATQRLIDRLALL
jgi:hypothetical protein